MPDIALKRNDRLPVLRATLKNPDGSAVNLAGTSQRFLMRLPGATAAKVTGVPTVVDASNGIVQYAWAAADTDTAGTFQAEIEVTFAGGLIQTYPNNGYLSVAIIDDLG